MHHGGMMMEKRFAIDLSGAETVADVHDALENALPMPDHYGRNLDALYDVLTEFADDWHIIIEHEEEADPGIRAYIDKVKDTFEEAASETEGLVIDEADES